MSDVKVEDVNVKVEDVEVEIERSVANAMKIILNNTKKNVFDSDRDTSGNKKEWRKVLKSHLLEQGSPFAYVPVPLTDAERAIFEENFVGFWLLESLSATSWSTTLIEFFVETTPDGDFSKAKLYTGTPKSAFGSQQNLREVFPNDDFFGFGTLATNFLPDNVVDVIYVEVLNLKSLRIIASENIIGPDDLTTTYRIQDSDPNLAVLYDRDDPRYGDNNLFALYRKLPTKPFIQNFEDPSAINWNDRVKIFEYINDIFFTLSNAQQAGGLNQKGFIGRDAAKLLFNQFLTTGVVRKAKVSTKKRGDRFIGVWRTQFPGSFPLTTIHTKKLSNFTPGSLIHISGFEGAYAVLNGDHLASQYLLFSRSKSTPYPWQCEDSREHLVMIQYDSSGIEEEYDPCVHGVAKLCAKHGPVTSDMTSYREFVAALIDYNRTVWGSATHDAIAYIRRLNLTIPETFDDLAAVVAAGGFNVSYRLKLEGFRDFAENGLPDFYHNPVAVADPSLLFPQANINDPFGLGLLAFDPKYNYDIDLRNYVDFDTVRNLFWTITGPELPDQPVTSLLVTPFGYPSNGSRVVFTTAPFLQQAPGPFQFPSNLVDDSGTHPWRIYGTLNPNPNSGTVYFNAHFNMVAGIVKPSFTNGEVTLYIRVGRETGFDSNFVVANAVLVFGRNDMPNNKSISNEVKAMATLIEHFNLNYNPTRYIIDLRANLGGQDYVARAHASLFGGNRPGTREAIAYPDENRPPTMFENFQTAFNAIGANSQNQNLINTDLSASLFPDAIVRGNKKCKDLIIINDTSSVSAGDVYFHVFIGDDPKSQVHNLGKKVISRLAGDIDGRLFSSRKQLDAPPINTPTTIPPPLVDDPRVNPGGSSVIFTSSEGNKVTYDRFDSTVNVRPWTIPYLLLPKWYDQSIWQDLGYIAPRLEYPLDLPPPNPDVQETWKDVVLEYVITLPRVKRGKDCSKRACDKCQCFKETKCKDGKCKDGKKKCHKCHHD